MGPLVVPSVTHVPRSPVDYRASDSRSIWWDGHTRSR